MGISLRESFNIRRAADYDCALLICKFLIEFIPADPESGTVECHFTSHKIPEWKITFAQYSAILLEISCCTLLQWWSCLRDDRFPIITGSGVNSRMSVVMLPSMVPARAKQKCWAANFQWKQSKNCFHERKSNSWGIPWIHEHPTVESSDNFAH
jgi:hypothetical protein